MSSIEFRILIFDGRDTLFSHDNWVADIPLRSKFPRLFDLVVYKESTVEEMGRLGWEVTVHDTWRWLLDLVHGYSASGAYHFLTTPVVPVDRYLVDDVWHKLIPSKVSLFVWRLLRDRLPTKDNLARRRVIPAANTTCSAICDNLETARHLFLECNVLSSIWPSVLHWLGSSAVLPGELRHHLNQFIHMAGLPRFTHIHLKIISFASVWVIWKEGNNRIFNNAACNPSSLLEKIKFNSYLWLKSKQTAFSYSYHDWWKKSLLCMGVH
ncbi:uncharacterized protein [Medicago truncatula]|uniref:uncharacterized protein n=1 Tax=Medicago truncatula TaxID=3880 RepID=UPI000D2F24B3|nr:uncharacterized protein LOC112419242 [Medicago truncatula]